MNKDLLAAHQQSVLLLITHFYEDLCQGITDFPLGDPHGRAFAFRSAQSQMNRLQRCLPCIHELCYNDVAACDPQLEAYVAAPEHRQESSACCVLQQLREESHHEKK
jgi:hypothetical protein